MTYSSCDRLSSFHSWMMTFDPDVLNAASPERTFSQDEMSLAFYAGKRAALAAPPARTYAEGVEDAAKVALKHGSMLSLAQGHDDAEGQADRWYEGGKHSAQVIAAAIRLLSQGEKA